MTHILGEMTSDEKGGSRPVPDPTLLTTQQLLREVATSREIIETRLDAMDKAIELLQRGADRSPSVIDVTVRQLQALHEEKFRSIALQFIERDTRIEQTSRDSKVAVDAALQAAKEAVGEQNKSFALAISKNEAGTIKQIEQIGVLINATTTAINDKIDDIRTRLLTIETYGKSASGIWGYFIGGIGVLMSMATLGALVIKTN
jgi:hypothetical protein